MYVEQIFVANLEIKGSQILRTKVIFEQLIGKSSEVSFDCSSHKLIHQAGFLVSGTKQSVWCIVHDNRM